MSAGKENLYGIGGVYSTWSPIIFGRSHPITATFIGEITERDGEIEGTIIDRYGPANVSGSMERGADGNKINLTKVYVEATEATSVAPINYSLSQQENGIWTGHYEGEDVFEGHVELAISDTITPDPYSLGSTLLDRKTRVYDDGAK